ncbi:hypothetical protein FQA39_LY18054 [Lamprigera yunnana]|nr:hypothetical protein FQA39_LY18054 [Lamprigera yunnana]
MTGLEYVIAKGGITLKSTSIIKSYWAFLRYIGMCHLFKPMLFLRDPTLIKQMLVKDFEHFIDHSTIMSEDIEPLWGKHLFSLKGERWKQMRATLSPSFTSSKMKGMFELMKKCTENFVHFFQHQNLEVIEINLKDAFSRYANDVIASTIFGVECDSLKDPKNEFFLMGKEATNFTGFWKLFSFLFIIYTPKFAPLIGARMLSTKVSNFFRKLVKGNIEFREKTGMVRPDMIHLLMEARKGILKYEEDKILESGFAAVQESEIDKSYSQKCQELTDDDLVAQALIFFMAGFETSSSLLSFTVYELAVNSDVQNKLRDVIDDVDEESDRIVTYETVSNIKYLDMVLSECLRKWPSVMSVDRICVKPYVIQPTKVDEKPVFISKGDLLCLPMYPIHRDPCLYPNPDRFDPERFNEENKSNITSNCFVPFGIGPRSCIGSRFALLESKILLYYLVLNYEFVVIQKTEIPLKLSKKQFSLSAGKGFWVGFKRRRA